MDRRIHKVNRVFTDLIEGRFHRTFPLSGEPDEWNTALSVLKILGEELASRTVSRDYFHNIIDSVSDMVFVVSRQGKILDINRQVVTQLGREENSLLGVDFNTVLYPGYPSIFSDVLALLKANGGSVNRLSAVFAGVNHSVPVEVNASWLTGDRKRWPGIVITAKDISSAIKSEIEVLRGLIDREEQIRRRVARDLHESLGQQISGIKFHISAVEGACLDGKLRSILSLCNERLLALHSEMKEICFELMPRSLVDGGLIGAVRELCRAEGFARQIRFRFNVAPGFASLGTNWDIDIFRIVQEFISNARRHGGASLVTIRFDGSDGGPTTIRLRDNGKGYIKEKSHSGMGLTNIASRVKSHFGELNIQGTAGRGTVCTLIFRQPL